MRNVLNISYVGLAWGGFNASYAETTYPIDALTYEEAVALRDDLLASRNGKVEGKIEIVGIGGDFQSLSDLCIEQRIHDFAETEVNGRRVTTEVTTTEVIAPWLRQESASLLADAE